MQIEMNNGCDFLTFEYRRDTMTVMITNVVVNTQKRIGTGTCLLNQLISSFPQAGAVIYTIVRRDNQEAISFFQRRFKLAVVCPNFYADGTDAAIFKYERG